jgi:hypothetical protein
MPNPNITIRNFGIAVLGAQAARQAGHALQQLRHLHQPQEAQTLPVRPPRLLFVKIESKVC